MEKISRALGRIIEILLLFLMIVLVAVTFLQVLARFVLKFPTSWSQEVVRLCFVWIIFLGSAIAVREGTHLTLDMATSLLPKTAQKILRVLILLLIIGAAVILLYGGIQYCINCASKTMITLPWPADLQYISMPISGVLMIWYAVERLVRECRGKGAGSE